jgi:hypothetical protein
LQNSLFCRTEQPHWLTALGNSATLFSFSDAATAR